MLRDLTIFELFIFYSVMKNLLCKNSFHEYASSSFCLYIHTDTTVNMLYATQYLHTYKKPVEYSIKVTLVGVVIAECRNIGRPTEM